MTQVFRLILVNDCPEKAESMSALPALTIEYMYLLLSALMSILTARYVDHFHTLTIDF